jgi:hypothetical protein
MNYFTPKKSYILFLAGVFPEDCPDEDDFLHPEENLITTSYKEAENNDSESDDESATHESVEHESVFDNSTNEHENFANAANADQKDTDLPNLFDGPDHSIIEYDEIPDYFTGVDTWPKATNLLCWSCCISIPSMPWFVPISKVKKVISVSDDDEDLSYNTKEISAFKPHGYFCFPSCVKRYIRRVDDPKIRNKDESIRLLNMVYKEITGKDVLDIPEAEDKNIMMQYCGPKGVSLQQFREMNRNKLAISAPT